MWCSFLVVEIIDIIVVIFVVVDLGVIVGSMATLIED